TGASDAPSWDCGGCHRRCAVVFGFCSGGLFRDPQWDRREPDMTERDSSNPSGLTLRGIRARPAVLKLRRPIRIKIATITDWPLVLVDLLTEEGVTGRSYVGPYAAKSMRYLVPMLEDLGEALK